MYTIVTGAAGFIGANLIKGLNARGVDNIIAVDNLTRVDKFNNLSDCEISDYLDKEEFIEVLDAGQLDGAVDAVLHQGACSDTMETDGRYLMANNYRYSVSLLDFCLDQEVPLLYASSASVYGGGSVFREAREFEKPLNGYGYSKFLFDQVVRRRLPRRVRRGGAGRGQLCRAVAQGEVMNDIYRTLEDFVGDTPLARLKRIPGKEHGPLRRNNVILAKLEGNNPAGSVKDRPALSMIQRAEARGEIKPGDTLIEATSGNTGIALAMAASLRGYRMILIMPENQSIERRQTMRAFGAELVLTAKAGGMEVARDVAEKMRNEGRGIILDQFANPDNPLSHYEGTGPEIWRDTAGRVTHFVSSMGTTGTIMGVSRFLKEQNPAIQIIGCQPEEGSQIAGIRTWPEAYLPKIFDRSRVDRIENVSQAAAEDMTRRLAHEEGIFAGVSSGGALAVALRVAGELENAVVVTIVCDRGDRYLSTGVFPA